MQSSVFKTFSIDAQLVFLIFGDFSGYSESICLF